MESIYNDIIGVGVVYPIELTENEDGKTGWYPINTDKLIEHNVTSILNYHIGQRFGEETFGNRLLECIEEPNTRVLSFVVDKFLKDCIGKWEPRLTYKSSKVTRVDSKLYIEVTYVIDCINSSKSAMITYDLNK